MKFVSIFSPVNLPADPAISNNGDLYFNTASNVYRVGVSGSWVSLLDTGNMVTNVRSNIFHLGGEEQEIIDVTLTQEYANGILHIGCFDSGIVNIPLNSSEPIEIGSIFKIIRTDVGEIVVAAATGVTLNSPSLIYLKSVWDSATLIKVEEDSWVLEAEFRDLY